MAKTPLPKTDKTPAQAKAERKARDRRRFLMDTARAGCAVSLPGFVLAVFGQRSQAHPAEAIRPPGALVEPDFLAACVRCGLCVQDCPYDTLKLSSFDEPLPSGTPYFIARAVPCEMCDDIPCVKACPSGALDPQLTDIEDADMGVAALVGREECLNVQGLRCDVCYRVCPLIDEAITLELQSNVRTGVHAVFIPKIHADKCTGCGKCEQACVLEETAIRVLPRHLAQGKVQEHYRWGWVEKDKAGKSLLNEEIIDLPDRMPTPVIKPFDGGAG